MWPKESHNTLNLAMSSTLTQCIMVDTHALVDCIIQDECCGCVCVCVSEKYELDVE